MAKKAAKRESTAANIGFEAKLWLAADKLRSNMDAAEYKHVVMGLIFHKYISDSFDEHHKKLVEGKGQYEGATRKILTNTKLKTFSGYHRKHAGRIFRPMRNNRASGNWSMMPWSPLNATTCD